MTLRSIRRRAAARMWADCARRRTEHSRDWLRRANEYARRKFAEQQARGSQA